MKGKGRKRPPKVAPLDVFFDHRFYFFIYDDEEKAALFSGCVGDPNGA